MSGIFKSDPKNTCSTVQLVPGQMEVNSLELLSWWSYCGLGQGGKSFVVHLELKKY